MTLAAPGTPEPGFLKGFLLWFKQTVRRRFVAEGRGQDFAQGSLSPVKTNGGVVFRQSPFCRDFGLRHSFPIKIYKHLAHISRKRVQGASEQMV
jgi:hypothetical protein